MRVALPIRRNGGTAATRIEEARVERAVDAGRSARLRLPGFPHFDLPVELLAGLLDSQPQHPLPPRPDQAHHAAHFTSGASGSLLSYGSPSRSGITLVSALFPAELAAAAVGGLVLGAGLVGVFGVAAVAVGLVRAFPRMTLGAVMAAAAIACQESEAQTAVAVPVPARAGPQPQSRLQVPPQGARFSAGECQVCLDPLVPGGRRTVMLLPCGHHCLHGECFEQLFYTHGDRRCPLCRVAVEATVSL
uniref:RING-type domain-containing protein n=1 Tax=Alexandrium catenella TaxID=2925 RepID=A0A7S1MKC5_ALECA